MNRGENGSLSLMLCCNACQHNYTHKNINFEKPNDFITCPHCKKKSFLHKSIGNEQEKYFEILGSDFSLQKPEKSLAEAELSAIDGNISEENLRLWINDTLSKTPDKDLPQPEKTYNRKSSVLSNLLDNMFTHPRVTYKNGQQRDFDSFKALELAIRQKQVQANDTLDYKNERAILAKHSKTKMLFMDTSQKELLESLKHSKTEVFTGDLQDLDKSKTGLSNLSALTNVGDASLLVKVIITLLALAVSIVIAFFAYKTL
ncbi:MAG TPA: hypothetical protein PKC21_04155 [Oligoflexia bacterium]|nr:hypothetical protein [Oligoflexia bacterium]HMR24531.1 hypothetical protein [Oligoflexia bacterium]